MVILISDKLVTYQPSKMKKTWIFKENPFDPLDSDFGYERKSPSVSKVLANTMKVLIEHRTCWYMNEVGNFEMAEVNLLVRTTKCWGNESKLRIWPVWDRVLFLFDNLIERLNRVETVYWCSNSSFGTRQRLVKPE